MILNISNKFKSLDRMSTELPDFTILTGLNGSGKTQILTSIFERSSHLNNLGDPPFSFIKFVSTSMFIQHDNSTSTIESINGVLHNTAWGHYKYFINLHKADPIRNFASLIQSPILLEIFKNIAENSKKNLNELTGNDFYEYYESKDMLESEKIYARFEPDYESDSEYFDPFQQNISNIFKNYKDNYSKNEFNGYLNNKHNNKEKDFISDEQFIKLNGEPPWEFINKILNTAKLDYELTYPISSDWNDSFDLYFINKINGSRIKIGDLSSGEKVLMALSFAMYNSKLNTAFPQVLLMDEPDSSLHPAMSKQFLDIIQKLFVEEKGVRVIMTTHSPSTVALANEESLYVVNKTGKRIEKTSKDKALKILTTGVPSFSVNYENRRQVFVESHNDVSYFEKIYEKMSKYLDPEISLTFISSGDSRTDKFGGKVANCEQVINIVNILRESGNKFVWGIIDFDEGNTSSNNIQVLGDGNRDNIESYLFDPLLVAGILLWGKYIKREELGLNNNETYTDFKNITQEQLQVIADFIIQKVKPIINPIENILEDSLLLNGKIIKIPKWYLLHDGHTLETAILEAFPKLDAIKRKQEESLKLAIIDKIIDDVPEIISMDLLNVLKSVQEI